MAEEPGMEEGQPHGKPWGTVAVREMAESDGCWRVMVERRQGKGRCPHGCRPLWSVLDIAGTAVPAG